MKTNENFGKLDLSGNIEYAPSAFHYDGRDYLHPMMEDYINAGFLPVVDEYPEMPAPEGFIWQRDGWEIVDETIKRRWKAVEDPYVPAPMPPKPRQFSKLKIVAALKEVGEWEHVKEWINDNDMYDLYAAAQNFAEDNPYFSQALDDLKDLLGWNDQQVEAILQNCILEN